jgi:hypothetical protein
VDIVREREYLNIVEYEIEKVKVNYLESKTNGLSYIRLKFSLENMTDMHRKFINIFC